VRHPPLPLAIALATLVAGVGTPTLADDPAPTNEELVAAVESWWDPLVSRGDPAPLREAFDLRAFAKSASGDLPLAEVHQRALESGIESGMAASLDALAEQLVALWRGGWFAVGPVTREGDVMDVEVALYSTHSDSINFARWRCHRVGGAIRWIDFHEMANGTWMRTRLTGITGLLLLGRIGPTDVQLCRAFGEAAQQRQWKEVRRLHGMLPAVLQDHRAILPTARLAAHTLADRDWADALRERYVAALGDDETLVFGDIDHAAMFDDLEGALAATRRLGGLVRDHAIVRYKASQLALRLDRIDLARELAQSATEDAPDFFPAFAMKVACFAREKKFAEAVTAVTEVERAFPARKFDWLDTAQYGDLPRSPEFFAKFKYGIR